MTAIAVTFQLLFVVFLPSLTVDTIDAYLTLHYFLFCFQVMDGLRNSNLSGNFQYSTHSKSLIVIVSHVSSHIRPFSSTVCIYVKFRVYRSMGFALVEVHVFSQED